MGLFGSMRLDLFPMTNPELVHVPMLPARPTKPQENRYPSDRGSKQCAGGAVAAVLRPGGGLCGRAARARAVGLPGRRHVRHPGRHGRVLLPGAHSALGPARHLVGCATPQYHLPPPAICSPDDGRCIGRHPALEGRWVTGCMQGDRQAGRLLHEPGLWLVGLCCADMRCVSSQHPGCTALTVPGVADAGLVVFFAVRSMLSTGRVLATLLLERAPVKGAAA